MANTGAPDWVQTLVSRYDPDVLAEPGRRLRVELKADEQDAWEVVLADARATVGPASGGADATISADPATWERFAAGAGGAVATYVSGELSVRRNLHVGVGFLAATSGSVEAARPRFRYVATRSARLSTIDAGEGPPVLAVHGLGATKGSFLPTVAALSDRFRVIALDLPGFGDSEKPLGAAYDARFFASACVDLLDVLELDRVHVVGNSLGGRVALELALRHLTPSGRAPFYAAARHIYLDEPRGVDGLWTRLGSLEPDALFVWGCDDKLVPIGFKRPVADALPRAQHLELDCGHVPQIERPGPTNDAIAAFFSRPRVAARRDPSSTRQKRAAA
jgi:pimeloyl-ACP methyl ester carboxylesterase